MLITTEGIIIRMEVKDISILGRITSGVKLINMDDDITVASMSKVREEDKDQGEDAVVIEQSQTEEIQDSGEDNIKEEK